MKLVSLRTMTLYIKIYQFDALIALRFPNVVREGVVQCAVEDSDVETLVLGQTVMPLPPDEPCISKQSFLTPRTHSVLMIGDEGEE